MMELQHYIVIRFFNGTLGKFTEQDLLSDVVLKMGTTLLEENLLKSLENQTCKNFEVILLVNARLQQSSQHYQKLAKLSKEASFQMKLMTHAEYTDLLASPSPRFKKRIISRIDYDDLLVDLAVADTQSIALKPQQKPIVIYGYNKGWIWRDDTRELYEVDRRYGFSGHFSAMQSVILDLDSQKREGLLQIHPYIWDHSSISTGLDRKFIYENVQMKHNLNLRAYVWMRHQNTGSIDPYKFKGDRLDKVSDQKMIQALDFETHFGRRLEIKI